MNQYETAIRLTRSRTDEDVKIASEIDEHVQNNRKRSFRVNVIN